MAVCLSALSSRFPSDARSIFTRKSSGGITWKTEAKWYDRSTYLCCLPCPHWPLILLGVDVFVGMAQGCTLGGKLGWWRRRGGGSVWELESRCCWWHSRGHNLKVWRQQVMRWWVGVRRRSERGLALTSLVGSVAFFSTKGKYHDFLLASRDEDESKPHTLILPSARCKQSAAKIRRVSERIYRTYINNGAVGSHHRSIAALHSAPNIQPLCLIFRQTFSLIIISAVIFSSLSTTAIENYLCLPVFWQTSSNFSRFPPRMTLTDSSDPLTFPLAPLPSQNCKDQDRIFGCAAE